MKTFRQIFLLFSLLITAPLYGQKQIIAFQHDTIRLEQSDTIYYRKGNEFKGEIKYGSTGYNTIIIVDSGCIIKRTDFFPNPNGQKWSESEIKNCHSTESYKEWNKQGKLIVSGHYSNGYRDSVWTFYFSNGVKESEGSFLPDTTKLIDFMINQNEINNEPPYEQHTLTTRFEKAARPHGKWTFYDKQGKRIKTLIFDHGVITSIEVGDWIEDSLW